MIRYVLTLSNGELYNIFGPSKEYVIMQMNAKGYQVNSIRECYTL